MADLESPAEEVDVSLDQPRPHALGAAQQIEVVARAVSDDEGRKRHLRPSVFA